MTYIQGFVVAVPTAEKQAYRDHADKALPLLKEFGAGRMVEGWGDDVPDGKLNDLKGAVLATADETVVFSWIEYVDRATCDAASETMASDPRMAELGDIPFDGARMIWGGFTPLLDVGAGGTTGYVDGLLVPVAHDRKDAYADFARTTARLFLDHGAIRVVEAWGDNVTDGKVTDFRRATLARDDEAVVFSWIEWPSKEVRGAGWDAMMADDSLATRATDPPFDGARMIYGGFVPLIDQ